MLRRVPGEDFKERAPCTKDKIYGIAGGVRWYLWRAGARYLHNVDGDCGARELATFMPLRMAGLVLIREGLGWGLHVVHEGAGEGALAYDGEAAFGVEAPGAVVFFFYEEADG